MVEIIDFFVIKKNAIRRFTYFIKYTSANLIFQNETKNEILSISKKKNHKQYHYRRIDMIALTSKP